VRSELKPKKLQQATSVVQKYSVSGLMGTVVLSLVMKLVYVFPYHPVSCLWGCTVALMPEMAVWLCPAVLPSQPYRVVHNLKIHVCCFLFYCELAAVLAPA